MYLGDFDSGAMTDALHHTDDHVLGGEGLEEHHDVQEHTHLDTVYTVSHVRRDNTAPGRA